MFKTKSGFTIVELLIVIVVIAILAAISVVAYNGIQQRAKISALKQEMSQLHKTIQVATVQNGGEVVTMKPPLAYVKRTTKSSEGLTEPIVSGQEATIYAVFDTTNNMASSWGTIAQFTPSVHSSNKIQLRTNGSNESMVNGAFSTSSQSDQSITTSNIRNTTGRHVGWATATPGTFVSGFDNDIGASRSLSSHDGWNFTDVSLYGTTAGASAVATIVYPEYHDENARRQILRWLDSEYTIDFYN